MRAITGSPQYFNRMDYYAIKPPPKGCGSSGLNAAAKTQGD